MASKRFISSLLGPTAFFAASLTACIAEDGGGDEGATDVTRSALVDFGNGPIEIQFEDQDGEAIFEGDIVLGKTKDVERGVLKLFRPVEPKGTKAPEEPESPEEPAAVKALEARNLLEAPEPAEDLDAPDELDVSKLPDVVKEPPRVAHAALAHLNSWPGGRIPFEIDGNLSQTVRDRIATAIGDWNSLTIVRLVPRSSTSNEHFVRFTGPTRNMAAGEGNSAIGFADDPFSNEPQLIRLGASVSTSTIRHEIGHTVGLFHEQSRTDRDNFIDINWANIRVDKWGNFMSYLVSGIAGLDYRGYDLESIMHYNSFNGFAVDPSLPTLVIRGCSLVSTAPECIVTRSSTLTSSDRRGVTRLVSGDPLFKFRIRSEATNQCLRPENGTTAANARVILTSCTNTASRRWYEYTRAGTTVPMIINEHSRLCLSRDTNNRLIQARCVGSASQRYQTIDAGFNALFGGDALRSNGRCLTRVAGAAQPTMSTTCSTTSSNRRWFKDVF